MSDLSDVLRLFITNRARWSRLDVGGEIDLATIDALRQHLDLLVESGTGDVDIDMGAVTFCDATVLRVLVSARQSLEADGRDIRIVNASAPMTRLLQLTGLDTNLLPLSASDPSRESRVTQTCRTLRTPASVCDGLAQQRSTDAHRSAPHPTLG
jgi:anti-sigma B factor antagonist